MNRRARGGMILSALLATALATPQVAVAAQGGSGGDGDLYSDLVIALRHVDGTPVFKQHEVTEEDVTTTTYCVQPVSYAPIEGVSSVVNAVDGRTVWPIPLMGDLPAPEVTVAAEDETEVEVCDPQPEYAEFVSEVELERLNLVRTQTGVLNQKIADVNAKLAAGEDIDLDAAGRLVVKDSAGVVLSTLDASPEYAAIYLSLMTDGLLAEELALTLPVKNEDARPGANGEFDMWEMAAAAVGTAAGKYVPLSVDAIVYYAQVAGITGDNAAAMVDLIEVDEDGKTYLSYEGFTYNRSKTFPGGVTWLDVPRLTWNIDRILEKVSFTNLTGMHTDAQLNGLPGQMNGADLHGVLAFAQMADDVRSVVAYLHENEVVPGFYMDPVGVDTYDSQVVPSPTFDPSIGLTLPTTMYQSTTYNVPVTVTNPADPDVVTEKAQVEVEIDAAAGDLEAADLSVLTGDVPLVLTPDSSGNLIVTWPEEGFPLPEGFNETVTFAVTVTSGAPVGLYTVTLDLVDLDASDPDAAGLAEATATTDVRVYDSGGGGGGGGVPVVPPPAPVVEDPVTRVGGADRIETAILLSQERFDDGEADAAVIARADDFPDALAAIPLTKEMNAPLLLTRSPLDDRVLAEVERAVGDTGDVYITGGVAAVSEAVELELEDNGHDVTRYAGADRYGTAVAVAEALGIPEAILLATGLNFPDALSGGTAAAQADGVIVLTAGDKVPAVTQDYLEEFPSVELYALGGPAAAAAPLAEPIVGTNRYDTAAMVAAEFFTAPAGVSVASGVVFADAMSGGADAAAQGWPLLLTQPTVLDAHIAAYIGEHPSVVQVDVYGGEAAISAAVFDALVDLLAD